MNATLQTSNIDTRVPKLSEANFALYAKNIKEAIYLVSEETDILDKKLSSLKRFKNVLTEVLSISQNTREYQPLLDTISESLFGVWLMSNQGRYERLIQQLQRLLPQDGVVIQKDSQ